MGNQNDLMTPGEVAKAFDVRVATVARWADSGKLPFERTLGGHRRYYRAVVNALLVSGISTRSGK